MKRSIFWACALILVLSSGYGCGGGGGGSSNSPAPNVGSNNPNPGSSNPTHTNVKSFSTAGSPITIDNIVSGSSSSSTSSMVSSSDQEVSASSTSAFYFGRFFATEGVHLVSGSVKFKLNKQDNNEAYFSDFTLEHYSEITGFESHSDIISSSVNLDVSSSFDSVKNHVEISNATKRFVRFDLDFGNNTYFNDINNAGVIFSSDFTTMVGGDDSSFFFIAQKASSQPDISLSALMGSWKSICFRVNTSTGDIILTSASTITVGGTGGNGFTAFTGVNTGGPFNGEGTLADPISAAFFYGYGSGSGIPTATTIDGAFLISADQSLAVGYDLLNNFYFAVER